MAQTYACYLSWPHVQALIISDSKYITLPSARITVLCKPIALVTYNIAGWHPKEKNNKSAGHEGQHTLSSLVHRANWSAWKLATWRMFLKQHFWNCFMFMACTKQTDKEGKLKLVYTQHAPFHSETARQSTMDWNRTWGGSGDILSSGLLPVIHY